MEGYPGYTPGKLVSEGLVSHKQKHVSFKKKKR
jgi:hypothetical protein